MMFSSLFAGGRLADVGAQQAGCELGWDIEINPAIAEIGAQLGGQTKVASVLDCDPFKFEKPDILWASPPCPNFSVAKANRAETALDRALAEKIIDFLRVLRPQHFVLENVEGYKRSQSLQFIEGALYGLGYWVDRQILNAADYGVPQTRKRLILRAVHQGFVPGMVAKQSPWQGWYGAIEDIIDTLPESKFADWQLERLPEDFLTSFYTDCANPSRDYTTRRTDEPATTVVASAMRRPVGVPKAFLVESKNAGQQYGDGIRHEWEPSTTVTTDHKPSHQPKAFLVGDQKTSGKNGVLAVSSDTPSFTVDTRPAAKNRAFLVAGEANNYGRGVTIVDRDSPTFTVKASGAKQKSRAWLSQGIVVAMNARAMGRFQSLPDSYTLPDSKWASVAIGNGVPCFLAQRVVESFGGLG